MEKQRALSFLLSLLTVVYKVYPYRFGTSFRKEFITMFGSLYSSMPRKNCLKAVSVIRDFHLRNKMICILDSLRVNYIDKTPIEKVPIDKVLEQCVWVFRVFDLKDDAYIMKKLFEICKKVLPPNELGIFFNM